MPLSRQAPRLLRQVNNQPHATAEDHEGPHERLSSSSLSELAASVEDEDVFRDPESSEDERDVDHPTYQVPAHSVAIPAPAKGKKILPNIHAPASKPLKSAKEDVGSQVSKKRKFALPGDKDTKDVSGEGPGENAVESMIRSSQENKGKRARTALQPRATYGKSTSGTGLKQLKTSNKPKSPKRPGFRQLKSAEGGGSSMNSSNSSMESPKKATFKKLAGKSTIEEATGSSPISSCPNSTLDEEVAEVEKNGDQDDHDIEDSTVCPLCGQTVEEAFKLDFEIEHCRGKRMNLRTQERFCQAHRTRYAQDAWRDRSYPKVEWESLLSRLEKHRDRIRDILDGSAASHYRQEVEKKVRLGKTKTAMQTWSLRTGSGASVGYYGAKGGNIMTDYILQTFSDKLRDLASTDKLIAAKGVSGGVSGYVQSVLVPELASCLVMEDAAVDAVRAREILAESADIGDVLNEEEEEKVQRKAASTQMPAYGAEEAEAIR